MSTRTDLAKRYQEYKRKKQEKGESSVVYTDVRDKYQAYKVKKAYEEGRLEDVIKSFSSRFDTYTKNAAKYIGDYNTRFVSDDSTDTGEDTYFYRSDSKEWLDSVTSGRDALNLEGERLSKELEFYKPYVNEEWYNAVLSGITGNGKTFDSIVEKSNADHEWWSKWENEDAYKDDYYNYTFRQKYSGVDTQEKWQTAQDDFKAQNRAGLTSTATPRGIVAMPSEETVREAAYLQNLGNYFAIKDYDGAAAKAEIDSLQSKNDELWNDIYKMRDLAANSPLEYEAFLEELAYKWGLETKQDSAGILSNESTSGSLTDNLGSAWGSFKTRRGTTDKALEALYESIKQELPDKKAAHSEMLKKQEELLAYEGYEALRQNEDFGERSKYVSNYEDGDAWREHGGVTGSPITGYTVNWSYNYADDIDVLYEYINRNDQLVGVVDSEDMYKFKAVFGKDNAYLKEMTDDEISLYNYIYSTEGKESADEYIDFIANAETGLYARSRGNVEEMFSELAKEHPVAASVFDIILSPTKGVAFIGQTVDYLEDQKITDNASYNAMLYASNASRSTVSQDIEKNWGKPGSFAYGVGMSMGEFLMSTAASGGNSTIAGIIMASGAAADTTLSGVDRGLDSTRAYSAGVIAGAAEFFTEKMGVDNLLDTKLLGKSWSKYILKNTLSEGAEEGVTDLINWAYDDIYDILASQNESEWKKAIAQYEQAGYSSSEALGKALGDRAIQLGLDVGAGAISGGIMGSGGAAINSIGNVAKNTVNNFKTGNSVISKYGQSGVGALAQQGLGLNSNTAAYKQAAKVQSKIDGGKKVSSYSVGKLYNSMSESQTSTAVQTRLSAHIENKTDVRKLSNTITDILYGREVSDKAISAVAANKYALNALNDALGAKLGKNATVSDVKAAIKSYQETSKSESGAKTSTKAQQGFEISNVQAAKDNSGVSASTGSNQSSAVSDVKTAEEVKAHQEAVEGESGANAPVKAQQGSTAKNSGQGDAQFTVEKNADGGYDVVAEADGERQPIMSYKSQKQAQAAMYAMILEMGPEGLRGLVAVAEDLPGGVDLGEAALAFNAYYNQGKQGNGLSSVKNMELLSPDQRHYARNLGIMDNAWGGAKKEGGFPPASDVQNSSRLTQRDATPAGAAAELSGENSNKVLQNDGKSGKINNNKESAENEQGVRLRDGSERDGGQDSGGQVSAVESGARQDQSREENGSRSRDREAASLTYGKEVSAKSLGIEGGQDSGKVHLIAEGSETASMKKARKRAEKRGKKVTFFAGGNLDIELNGEIASVRGYIEGDQIYIRVDHPYYTSDQLMRHEIGHDMIANGEVDLGRVRERIEALYDDVDFIVEQYRKAYEGSGLDANEIWEEIICDSLGDMNAFASVEVLGEMNDEFLEALKEETRKSAKDARGPPKSAEGKASREYWYPKLANQEWSLLNRTMNRELSGSKNYIDEATKWLYAEEKGVRVFAIYGIGDGTEATVLYAVGGRSADSMTVWRKKYESGLDQTKRNPYRKHLDSIRVEQNKHGFGIDGNGQNNIRGNGGTTKKTTSRAGQIPNGTQRGNNRGAVPENSKRQVKGKASQDLDFVDFLNENLEERERSNREILANLLETEEMSPSEKGFLTKYKNKIAQIEANEAEISEMESELKELRRSGKKDSSRAITLEGKIKNRELEIARDENMILNLESTKPIKELLKREKNAAYAEGMLAGQMAQGRQDAAKLRKTEEKFAEQKRKDGETLAEYKKRVAEREAEIKQKNREKMAEQREKARENLDAQAKRYQESRKKATEGRHKTAMRHKIAGVVSELDKLLRKGTKERNVKIGLQDAVASALEIFDLNSEKVERYNKAIADLDARIAVATDPVEIEALTALREKKVRNSERLADKLQVMKKAYEDIHNGRDGENYPSYYKAECEAIENRIADVMEKVGDTPIGEMSLEQLEAVYDMYRMVLTTVRNANKVFKDGKLADLTADAADMTSELQRIKKLAEERLKAGDDIRGFVWNELTPYYAFNRIGSDTLMSYYNELIRGQDVYARDIEEAQSFAEETRKKHGYGKWKLDKVQSFRDADGRDFRLTLRHMMSIYAYSKREQAFDHMEKGGFFFNNKETFRKKAGVIEFIASNESGYKVDARIFAQIKGALTAEQIAYVDEMQAYLTQMGEKGNEVTRQMWGIDLFKEKAYFPLKSKEDFIYQANTPAETSSLKNDGMTKETKPHASNPIVLESFDDVWANHVEKMSKYHGFVIPIDNLNKILNYGTWLDGDAQSISTTLEARYGSGANDYLTTFIKDLNGAKAQSGGLIGGAFDLLTKFKKTSVAASLSVVVQQPTAILRATSEINPKYFAYLSKPERLSKKWDQIQKYAPIAIIKDIGGFDAGSGKQITEWMNADTQRGTKKVLNKIDDLTMYGAALGDRIGWGAIWQAVIREVQAKQGLTYGTEEFWQACGKRFTDVIVKTQVYDSTLSRSGFMRGKDGLMKMATAFMGEPTLSINMLADTLLQAKRGKISKGQVVRTFAAVYTATVAASIIKSFIYALRDDDEDESYAEKYMQALGGTILDDINPLSMLPILRDVVSIFQGWDVERTDMAVVQDLYNAINSLSSENKTTYRKIEDLAGAVAALVGVPVKNVMRTAREIYNAIDDIFDGIDGGDLGGAFLEGITGEEKGKSQTLYEALVEGDPERLYAIKKTYKTEESYLTAVRKALRTYDPRIKEAAQAQIDGDISRRNALLREVVGEGIFDEMTVSKAITAEVNSIKDEESSSAEPEDDTPWYDRKEK